MDYLFGQMKPGSGSGVAKITSGSKKHKISEGSWIVKAKEKGTVVKESIVFKMFVFEDEQEDLAKKYAASLYDSQLPDPLTSGSGGFSLKFGGVFPQYSILMYPAVFRCILLKYCILAYSDVFQNVFSYLLVCDRDTLCFMYPNVFRMYSKCILRICGAPRRPRG